MWPASSQPIAFGLGRADDRQRGTLRFLEPGGRQDYRVEIGVLESLEAIDGRQPPGAAPGGHRRLASSYSRQ